VAFAQPPGSDYTYETPSGYQVRNHPMAIEMSRIDQQRKYYCQVLLYQSQPSQGSAAKDAENEWAAVVVKQMRVRGQVVTKDLPLPWAPESVVRGAETTDGNGKPAITSLFVLRFPNQRRYVGVLFNVPNEQALQACQEEATKVVMSVRMREGTAAPPPAAPQQQAAPSVSSASGPAGNVASGSPVGVWERVIVTQPAGRYNMFTKQWEYDPVAAMRQFKQIWRFAFEPGGRYVFELNAEDYNRQEHSKVIERGRYAIVQGNAIQFTPELMQDGKAKRGENVPLTTKATPAGHTRRFLVGEHPQYKDSAGLQLQTGNGGWETYKPAK
jgi:hypothetical protein